MRHRFRPGDHVFYTTSNRTVAGEGMALGYLASSEKGRPEEVVILLPEGSFESVPAAGCTFQGTGQGPQGMAVRAAFLKKHPGRSNPRLRWRTKSLSIQANQSSQLVR